MLTRLLGIYVLVMGHAVFVLVTFDRFSMATAVCALMSGGAALYNGRALVREIKGLPNAQPVKKRALLVLTASSFTFLVGLSLVIWQISLMRPQFEVGATNDFYASVGFGLLAFGAALAGLLPKVGKWTTGF